MTEFKNILVPVADGSSAAPLNAAFGLASTFGSHVVGLHVRTDPTTAVPLVGEGMSGAMVEEMMSVAERQAATRAEQAKKVFDDACARHSVTVATTGPAAGVTGHWEDVVGREEDLVARRGRLSDLIVLGRPSDAVEGPSSLMTLNAALMESGKPLLLAPPAPPATIGKRVVIAWNGSAEASHAVASAMPLLSRAESVCIVTLAEDSHPNNTPASELAAALAWHDIRAKAKAASAGSQAGQVLLNECAGENADLLVMGAYTHSRLRQLILGGVTRHVLNQANICCLLCH